MTEPTVREALATALEREMYLGHLVGCPGRDPHFGVGCWINCRAACAALDRHKRESTEEEPEAEWLSQCCGAPPHEATSDVGEDNPAGICGQCREHAGFEPEALPTVPQGRGMGYHG